MSETQRFVVRSWHDGSVVFDRNLGDTHALDSTAATLFLAIQRGENSSPFLTGAIAKYYPDSTFGELALLVDANMAHLREIGLVDERLN